MASALALAGCSVLPVAFTGEQHSTQAQEDLAQLIDTAEPISAPLTMAESAARAIRHNLDLRVRQMETSVQSNQLDLSRYDMLPRLALSAGYSYRNNDSFGLGFQPDGTISSVPTAAVERIHHNFNGALSWNVLDFGLSYYRAKQNADQVLVSEERRRRTLQNLLLDVQLAWWRAEAAQRLLPQLDEVLTQIDRGAERSRLIEARKLLPPLQIIAYRRSLLDLQQQLSVRRQGLVQWRSEFAQLIGLLPGQTYRVAAPTGNVYQLPDLATHVDDLEAMAIERRPELAEERYRARITQVEGKKQMLAMLPNLSLNLSSNYESNKYLINNQWNEFGGLATFNLLKLLSLPATKRTQAAMEELDKTRRQAVAVAVMTQTRIAVNRYELLRHELAVWNEALSDDRSLLKAMKATQESGLETELELIRAGARLAITEIDRDVVHANLEHAMGRIMNSVGHDVVTAETSTDETPTLAAQLEGSVGKFLGENFRLKAQRPQAPVAVASITGLPDAVRPEFAESMRTVLRVMRIPVSDSDAKVKVDVALDLAAKQDSGRPVTLQVKLLDADGQKVLHTARMKSMLVEPITTQQWKVLGEAAVFLVAENLRALTGVGQPVPAAVNTLSLTEGNMLKLDRQWTGPRQEPAKP